MRLRLIASLKHLLTRARLAALGLPCPVRRPKGMAPAAAPAVVGHHHSFCRTWATWMRIYGGLDDIGLAATDRWRTVDAALRPRRRARRVAAREALPGVENPWKRASGDGK